MSTFLSTGDPILDQKKKALAHVGFSLMAPAVKELQF